MVVFKQDLPVRSGSADKIAYNWWENSIDNKLCMGIPYNNQHYHLLLTSLGRAISLNPIKEKIDKVNLL